MRRKDSPFSPLDERETVEEQVIEGEVVTDVLEGGLPGSTRTLRVYDKARGDFLIDIPSDARVTFGYFNPAAAGERFGGMGGRGAETMKTTALRIYQGSTEKSPQIGCFLAVDGFRDQNAIKLTRLRQRVVIESNFEDDGVGNTYASEKGQRALVQAVEDEIPF